MPAATFEQVRDLADQLSPVDQARLMETLTSRIARILATIQRAPEISRTGSVDAWDDFFQIGDALAAKESAESDTMTATLLKMRR